MDTQGKRKRQKGIVLVVRVITHSPIHRKLTLFIFSFDPFSMLSFFISLISPNPLLFLSFLFPSQFPQFSLFALLSLYTFLSNVFGMYPILQLDSILSPYQKYLASTEDKECQIHQNCLKNGSCHGPAVFRIVDGAHHGLMTGFKQQTKNR